MQHPPPTGGPQDNYRPNDASSEGDPDDGLTLGDVVELAARERRGESLTDREFEALARANALRIKARAPMPIVEKARAALAPALAVGHRIARHLATQQREYAYEIARVKALSSKRRARFEHLTLPQIRDALRHNAPTPRIRERARECRPAARRRASSSSTTSSADPGSDGESESPGGLAVGPGTWLQPAAATPNGETA